MKSDILSKLNISKSIVLLTKSECMRCRLAVTKLTNENLISDIEVVDIDSNVGIVLAYTYRVSSTPMIIDLELDIPISVDDYIFDDKLDKGEYK